MPSFSTYKRLSGSVGATNGEARTAYSKRTYEATWYEDIATKHCYFYDFNHDNEPLRLTELHPDERCGMIPIDVKYIISTSQSLSKDDVDYHIQFKPSAGIEVPYYQEEFGLRYNAEYPVGLYVAIPDTNGAYNKWLVVATANNNDTLFPTYSILRCDKVFQWVFDGKCYQMPGVLRSQNSYNSGIWEDDKFSSVEDQQKFMLPLTRTTEHLFYNQRMIVDNFVLTQPRAWQISKINRINQNGVVLITLKQDRFDQTRDYIELDDNGNVIGMWADYYAESIQPIPDVEDNIYAVITYAAKPQIKVAGSYKKLTVTFYKNNEETNWISGTWSYTIDGLDVSGLITSIDGDDGSQIKIRFDGDDSYIGKTLVVSYTTSTGIVANVNLDIIGL